MYSLVIFSKIQLSKMPKNKLHVSRIICSANYRKLKIFNKTCFYVEGERIFIFLFRCSSPVGRKFRNDISLGRNCWKKGVVMHEIAHSLGNKKKLLNFHWYWRSLFLCLCAYQIHFFWYFIFLMDLINLISKVCFTNKADQIEITTSKFCGKIFKEVCEKTVS